MLCSVEGFPHFVFTCMLAWLHGNATLMFSPFPSMSGFLSLLSILAFRRAGSWIRTLSGAIDPCPSSLVSTFTRFGRNPSPALQACFGRVCGWLQHGWRWDGWRWEIWRISRWSKNTWNTDINNSALGNWTGVRSKNRCVLLFSVYHPSLSCLTPARWYTNTAAVCLHTLRSVHMTTLNVNYGEQTEEMTLEGQNLATELWDCSERKEGERDGQQLPLWPARLPLSMNQCCLSLSHYSAKASRWASCTSYRNINKTAKEKPCPRAIDGLSFSNQHPFWRMVLAAASHPQTIIKFINVPKSQLLHPANISTAAV